MYFMCKIYLSFFDLMRKWLKVFVFLNLNLLIIILVCNNNIF